MTKTEPESPALVDAAARATALDPRRSFIVEAPAGSGKTTLLTQRLLGLLVTVREPEAVLAITFSRKAAEEMRQRVVTALTAVEQGRNELDPVTERLARAALDHSARHNWNLQRNPRRLAVMTIDALANQIARRNPLGAGVVAGAEINSEVGADYLRAARQAMLELGSDHVWSDDIAVILARLDNDWSRLERLLVEMLAYREQWLPYIVQAPTRSTFESGIHRVIETTLRALVASLPESLQNNLLSVAAYAGGQIAASGSDNPVGCLAGLSVLPNSEVSNLAAWQAIASLMLTERGQPRRRLTTHQGFPAKDATSKRIKTELLDLIAVLESETDFFQRLARVKQLPEPRLDDREWRSLAAITTVLKLAAAELKVVFQSNGSADFTEVTLGALAALGGEERPSDTQLLLDYRIQHVLVDEFQDTSVTQYRLIERLVAGWQSDDGRTLFLVGDPRQSIYRFRQADVSRFIETARARHFANVALDRVSLSANFRSDPLLINWVNDALATLSMGADGFQTTTCLSAVRPADPTAAVSFHRELDDQAGGEARAVVALVARLRTDNPQQSIAVLVRSRAHLGDVTRELVEAGVPISASDVERLVDQPVVNDLIALTRALLHPADRTAWLALLRAPWLGLDLAVLLDVGERSQQRTVFACLADVEVTASLPPPLQPRVEALRSVVETALAQVGRMPLCKIVASAWDALRGPEIAGSTAALNCAERYFDLLEQFETRGDLVTAEGLDKLVSEQFVVPPESGGNPVQVMTIHRAKGLEFDVVILPGLGRTTRSESRRLLMWRQTPDGDLLLSLLPEAGSDGRLYEYLRYHELSELQRESCRLLYVALTRARRQLHLVATLPDDKAEPAKGSFLQLLWSLLEHGPDPAGTLSPQAHAERAARISGQPRLRRMRTGPACERATRLRREPASVPRSEVEFSWARSTTKYVGTIVHELLNAPGTIGLETFERQWRDGERARIVARLREFGVAEPLLGDALASVEAAVERVIHSARGRWLFSDDHRDAHSEYPLTTLLDGQLVNIIVDRTFVDDKGIRWIVDFKTGDHKGGEIEKFLDEEQTRYRPQLDLYARVFARHEQRETRAALFYPLVDGWREWQPEH